MSTTTGTDTGMSWVAIGAVVVAAIVGVAIVIVIARTAVVSYRYQMRMDGEMDGMRAKQRVHVATTDSRMSTLEADLDEQAARETVALEKVAAGARGDLNRAVVASTAALATANTAVKADLASKYDKSAFASFRTEYDATKKAYGADLASVRDSKYDKSAFASFRTEYDVLKRTVDGGVFKGGIAVTNADPGPMIEKSYTAANKGDRYGVGQFPNGAMRVYAAANHAPATVAMAFAKSDGSFTDALVAANDGSVTAAGIKMSKSWSGYPDNASNRAEISNDTSSFKQLMIVGNKAAGADRRVGVWDRLDVHGELGVDRDAVVRGDLLFDGGNNWIVHTPDDGRRIMYVAPSGAAGRRDWNWDAHTRFEPGGKVSAQLLEARDKVCIGGTCINEAMLKKIAAA
jgi:hypothetical protein